MNKFKFITLLPIISYRFTFVYPVIFKNKKKRKKKKVFYGFIFTENVFVTENCFSFNNIYFKGFSVLKTFNINKKP